MSFVPKLTQYKNSDDQVLLAENPCPKCNTSNSLILMYQKDRYRRNNHIYSAMRIECFKCKWKVSGTYKWLEQANT